MAYSRKLGGSLLSRKIESAKFIESVTIDVVYTVKNIEREPSALNLLNSGLPVMPSKTAKAAARKPSMVNE